MRKNKITVTVIGVAVAVLFTIEICGCAQDASFDERALASSEENDVNEESSNIYSEDDESEYVQNEAVIETEPVVPVTIDIKKVQMNEAIVIDDTREDLFKGADGSEADYGLIAHDKELPTFYTSDQANGKDYITPVKNQGYTALCWNYAAIGAVESDLLIHHEGLSADSLNLSEKHGAYYNMHQALGSVDGGIDDDYREFVFIEEDGFLSNYDTSYLSVG